MGNTGNHRRRCSHYSRNPNCSIRPIIWGIPFCMGKLRIKWILVEKTVPDRLHIQCLTSPGQLFATMGTTNVWPSEFGNINRKSTVKLTLTGGGLTIICNQKFRTVTLIAPLLKSKLLHYGKGGLKQKYISSIKLWWKTHSRSLEVIYRGNTGMGRRLRIKHYLKQGFSCRLSTPEVRAMPA